MDITKLNKIIGSTVNVQDHVSFTIAFHSFILKICDSIYIKVRFVFVNLFSSPVVYYLNKYTYFSVKIKLFINLDKKKSNAALNSIFKALNFVLIPCLQITNFKLYSVLCKQTLKLIKAHSITLFSFKEFHYLTYCHNWDTISRAFKNRLLTFVSKANCNSFFLGGGVGMQYYLSILSF